MRVSICIHLVQVNEFKLTTEVMPDLYRHAFWVVHEILHMQCKLNCTQTSTTSTSVGFRVPYRSDGAGPMQHQISR